MPTDRRLAGLALAIARQAARRRRLADEATRRAVAEDSHRQAIEARLALKAERELLRATIKPGARTLEDSRQEKDLFLREKQHEANERATMVRQRWKALETILSDGLAARATFFLDDLRLRGAPPARPAPPELLIAAERPRPDSTGQRAERSLSFASLVSMARAQPEEDEATRLHHLAALDEWTEHERRRLESLTAWEVVQEREQTAFLLKQLWRAREIEAFGQSIMDGSPDAIATYLALALERSVYPEDVPRDFQIGFEPSSGLLVINMSMPELDTLPLETDIQYIQSSNQIVPVPMRTMDRKFVHSDVIAMIALRSIDEISGAAAGLPVRAVAFNGFFPRRAWEDTGPPHCIVSVQATLAAFAHMDLEGGDPKATLRALGGVMARPTDESAAVRPIATMPAVHPCTLPPLGTATEGAFRDALTELIAGLGFDCIRPIDGDDGPRLVAFDDHPLLDGKVLFGALKGDRVGADPVAAFLGEIEAVGALRGVLITEGHFDLAALDLADTQPVELIDGAGLKLLARWASRVEAA